MSAVTSALPAVPFSFTCLILAYSRKTLHHESIKILVQHAWHVAMQLQAQQAQLRSSVYQQTDACTQINLFEERKQDWPGHKFGLQQPQAWRNFKGRASFSPPHSRRQKETLLASATGKTMNTWNISGMFIVLWLIRVKIRTCVQATKPQTN